MIYLDNAATTIQKPPEVARAVLEAMSALGNSARGAHRGSLEAAHTVFGAREKLAGLFGCPRSDHVIFTCNVTEALNIALSGLLEPGDRAVTTALEHNSVLRPLYRLEEERGIELAVAGADRAGRLD
jgi:selenocysteine lyase/cysteine desulfurase